MIVLRITVIFEIILIRDAMFTEQIKPQLLEMSLIQVNQLLADIDAKISMERNLLSKLDKENDKDYRPTTSKSLVARHGPTRKKSTNDTHKPKISNKKKATTKKLFKKTSKKRANVSTYKMKQNRNRNIAKIQRNNKVKENNKIRNVVAISKARANLSEMLQQIFPESGVIPFIDRNKILRRRMKRNFRNIVKYNKLIRHFILKHSTLFYTFVKHYEQRHKHRHHNLRHHKKHRHRPRSNDKLKGNVRQAVNWNNEHRVKNSQVTKIVENERPPKSHKDLVEQPATPDLDKEEKRFRVEFLERYSQNGSSIQLKSILVNNNDTKNFEGFTKNGNTKMQNLTQLHSTTKNLILNNKILKEIVEESSYSDEELYLKTMLMDAFFHDNATLPSNLPKRWH